MRRWATLAWAADALSEAGLTVPRPIARQEAPAPTHPQGLIPQNRAGAQAEKLNRKIGGAAWGKKNTDLTARLAAQPGEK